MTIPGRLKKLHRDSIGTADIDDPQPFANTSLNGLWLAEAGPTGLLDTLQDRVGAQTPRRKPGV